MLEQRFDLCQSVADYEFLATRYSKYIDWTKEIKVIETLNKAKELNPPKAEEYDGRIKAIEENEKKSKRKNENGGIYFDLSVTFMKNKTKTPGREAQGRGGITIHSTQVSVM